MYRGWQGDLLLMNEHALLTEFLAKWQRDNPGGRLFRANAGMAWAGRVVNNRVTDSWREITIAGARPFHGMPTGTPDLIGWTQIEITPEMVGQRVAVFTGIELKTEKVRVTKEQENFRRIIEESGGIAKIIRE